MRREIREILEEADLLERRADGNEAQAQVKFKGFVEFAFGLRFVSARSY